MSSLLTAVGRRALRSRALQRAVLAAAARRRRSLVFVFHRIAQDPDPHQQRIVPTIPQDLLRRQIQALGEIGEIVPVETLIGDLSPGGPRFALTFDDDYVTHRDLALPLLTELGVTATFFLCGRSLHGLGPLWFEVLDRLVLERGVRPVGRWLGIDASDGLGLAAACENDRRRQLMIEAESGPTEHLRPDHIRTLAQAGMAIGFHTLRHPLMLGLGPEEAEAALVDGRGELESTIGERIRLFAYPHGKANRALAAQVEGAGYIAAWTGRPRPMRRRDDPYLLGRWEPGAISPDELIDRVAVRLNGWGAWR